MKRADRAPTDPVHSSLLSLRFPQCELLRFGSNSTGLCRLMARMTPIRANIVGRQRLMYSAAVRQSSFAITAVKESAMKSGAVILAVLFGVSGSAFSNPAFAQTAVGGATKQTAIGGPPKHYPLGGTAQQGSPVVTTPKGRSTPVTPPSVSTTATPPSPASTAAPSPSIVKCVYKGACVGPTKEPTNALPAKGM